jgi:hypothetical protein
MQLKDKLGVCLFSSFEVLIRKLAIFLMQTSLFMLIKVYSSDKKPSNEFHVISVN